MAFSIEIKRAKMLPKEISKLLDEYSAWMVKQYRSSRPLIQQSKKAMKKQLHFKKY
jgi:hypothetical protein